MTMDEQVPPVEEKSAVQAEAVEPAAVEPAAVEPAAVEPAAVEPAAVESAAVESAAVESGAVESAAVESAAVESAAVESAAVESAAVESAAVESAAVESAAVESAAVESAAVESAAVEPGAVAEAGDDGSPKKKRRRRRRKKKNGTDAGEAAANGAAVSSKGKKPKGNKPGRPERPAFNIGDEVFGRVTQVLPDALWIDVAGGKATALFETAQLIQIPPKVGEQLISKVKSLSTRGGVLLLGPELWDAEQARNELRAALESGNAIETRVTGIIKGGLEIDYHGIRGFAPASHVELRPNSDLSEMLGQCLTLCVVTYAKKGRELVFSRKAMLEEEHGKLRAEHLQKIAPDMVCKAVVRKVLNWGAFVSLPEYGDIEGVIHMSEASHDRGAKLARLFKVGAEIEAKILKIDEGGKLWLSHKAMLDDPWESVEEKFPVGSIHTLKVVRLTEFGAFIQLEPGIDGLCHLSDLSSTPIEHPSEIVEVGKEIEVVVASVSAGARKVSLHPAPPENERDLPRPKIALYKIVTAVVTQIHDNGIGVRIVGATGRVSRAYISGANTGTPRGTDLRKTFPLGKKLEAKIIEIDKRRGEARLSIRALKQDVERNAYSDYRKKVQRESGFGTFADLFNKQKS